LSQTAICLHQFYLTAILFGLLASPPHGDIPLALWPHPLTAKLSFNCPHDECQLEFSSAPSQQNQISIHLTANFNSHFSSASLGQYFIRTSQWYALLNHGDRHPPVTALVPPSLH
jgi:hypothetical protein